MSLKTILITGGAGFIGKYLLDALKGKVETIVILDNLLPQVHSGNEAFSKTLLEQATCIRGDIRDIELWKRVGKEFPNIETIVHLAAMTGTGQSMYALKEYDSVNCGGTATMIEALLDRGQDAAFKQLKSVVLASSRAVYGEGAYRCEAHPENLQYPEQRSLERLKLGEFGFACEICELPMSPVPTPEEAPLRPGSFYGVTKLVQEQYLRTMLNAAGINFTALRFQNVFGPGQSLKNPYTGVIGVFYSNLVGRRPISIYEDGNITRDFVYVTDVADALAAAVLFKAPGTFNIGSGEFSRLWDVSKWLSEALGIEVPMTCTGAFRVGDIWQNAADIRKAQDALGYSPKVTVREGLRRYVEWAKSEEPLDSKAIAEAAQKLEEAGLSGIGSKSKI